ncbi:MAG: hypothetical protein JXA54_06295 [Candidatus Heimdallarchaeota archaeon]|nr:hypothetical protein [Candidatus Heimdallarchaeota archaeon]
MLKKQIRKVEALPQWRTDLPDSSKAFTIGDTLVKTLKPKGSQSFKELREVMTDHQKMQAFLSEQRFEVITLEVKNQDPIELELKTENENQVDHKKLGVPVIMLLGESIDSSSKWKDIVGGYNLPGIPLAFAMGSFGKPASLKFRPTRDGFLRAVFWIIRGPLKPLVISEQGIPETMQKMFENNPAMKLSQLLSKEPFIRAWQGTNTDSAIISLDWDESIVKLSIRRGPENAPPPNDLLTNFLEKSKIELTKNQTDEQKKQETILEILNAFTIHLENKLEAWKNKGFSQDVFGDLNPLLFKLTSWSKHPAIQAPLVQIEHYFRGWSEKDILVSKMLNESQGKHQQLQIINSDATTILKEMLENLGAIDGVIVDKFGGVVAAIHPNIKLNLRTDSSWLELEKMLAKEILVTESHTHLNYDFTSRTIAVRIDNTATNLLGWLLLELYIG